jgi:hypothetical protein
MRGAIAAFVLGLVGTASAGAATMTHAPRANTHCRVVAGEKYLKAPINSAMICGDIARALAAQVPSARVEATVRVISPSRLAASLVVNGRALPEHKFAIMDSDLSPEAVQRFARSLAIAAADAAKR